MRLNDSTVNKALQVSGQPGFDPQNPLYSSEHH